MTQPGAGKRPIKSASPFGSSCPGFVPGIHVFRPAELRKTWMAGTSPAMTRPSDAYDGLSAAKPIFRRRQSDGFRKALNPTGFRHCEEPLRRSNPSCRIHGSRPNGLLRFARNDVGKAAAQPAAVVAPQN